MQFINQINRVLTEAKVNTFLKVLTRHNVKDYTSDNGGYFTGIEDYHGGNI